jgi:hypothetical protein
MVNFGFNAIPLPGFGENTWNEGRINSIIIHKQNKNYNYTKR